MLRTIRIIIGIILAPVALVACAWVFLMLETVFFFSIGHYPDYSPEDLAKKIVQEGKPAIECQKLEVVDPFPAPTEGSQRRLCEFYIAKLTQDPTVCKLLMPSDYGIRCLAEVNTARAIDQDSCEFIGQKKDILSCTLKNGSRVENLFDTIEDCLKYPAGIFRNICYSQRTASLASVNDCEEIGDLTYLDGCRSGLAKKEKSISLCDTISDSSERTSCQVTLDLWNKYPSYRCKLISDPGCKV